MAVLSVIQKGPNCERLYRKRISCHPRLHQIRQAAKPCRRSVMVGRKWNVRGVGAAVMLVKKITGLFKILLCAQLYHNAKNEAISLIGIGLAGAPGQNPEKNSKINGSLKKDHEINQLKGDINQRVTSSPGAAVGLD